MRPYDLAAKVIVRVIFALPKPAKDATLLTALYRGKKRPYPGVGDRPRR